MFNLQLFPDFHRTVHFTAILLFLQRLSLVEFLLTLTQRHINLGPAFVIDKHQGGHDGKTRLFGGTLKGAYFFLG